MGEAAEMLLDGTLCEGCGVFLGGGSPGYPRRCEGCRPPPIRLDKLKAALALRVSCPHCQRTFATDEGAAQHVAAKHPGAST